MSHFLERRIANNPRPTALGRRVAAVRVEPEDRGRVLRVHDSSIVVAKANALFVELPADVRVFGPDDKELQPSGRFMVSVETMDPIHLLLDVRD